MPSKKVETAIREYGEKCCEWGVKQALGRDDTWPEVSDAHRRLWKLIDAERPAITDEMVEAAAVKMWELVVGEAWLGWGKPAKPPYLDDARAVLAAALDAGKES